MESNDVFLGLHDFLERMRNPSAADFVKAIKSFIVSFSNSAPDPERDSAAVQEFLANMEAAFKAHPLWAGCTEEELESAGEGLEKYVMTKLFTRVFASLPDDVKLDNELSEKMALIQQFVRPENLDIKPMFQNETSWLLAQKELQKINMYKAPRDKLVCILNCCKVITNLLLNASIASNENPPGADEFLPVLIYVTLKANPPQLHSNLLYIERFRRKSRLVSESAYFFTNILSAESFISNVDAKALSMDETEFEKNMESARALLSGLSTDLNDQSNSSEQTSRHFSGVEQNKGKNLTTQSKPSEEKPSIAKVSSLLDLENRGAAMVLKEDQGNQVFQDFPYLFADVGALTINDVENLLNNYKQVVLKYVCLAKGLGISTIPPQPSTSQIQAEITRDSEASGSRESGDSSKVSMSRNNDSLDSLVSVLQKEENIVSNVQPEDHVAPHDEGNIEISQS